MTEQQSSNTNMILGGWTDPQPVTPEVKKYTLQVQSEAEKAADRKFEEYTPLILASQVVAGTNYLVKVKVQPDRPDDHFNCVHIKFFVPLPGQGKEVEFLKLFEPRTEDDSLVPDESS